MAQGSATRRLAAILAADVVGYSRLIGADETGTLARMKAHRAELWDPEIARFGGRLVGTAGDSLLVEFASAVAAVECALAMQHGMAEREADEPEDRRMRLRIGVNIGDVVIDGDDIHGDGVNVAARLEGAAAAGGIALADAVHAQIRGRLPDAAFVDGGEERFKNIQEPVRVWRWAPDEAGATPVEQPAVPDKPSIAVLPFDNMSSDPDQAFFADGIVEDLTTALSRFPWLFVVARNSSFSFKGRNVPVREVSKALGVRYVVEGSVRSSSSRLRVTVQLIDASVDKHVWAETYDRPSGDLFDLQDEITQSITGVLVPALSKAERERALRDTRPSLDAWREFQKGLAHYYKPYNDEDDAEARRLFSRATELDGTFSDAHAMLGLMGVYALDSGQTSSTASPAEIIDEAEREARLAVQCDDASALAHLVLGRVCGMRGDFETGIAECEMAVRLNPNFALAHHELGFILNFAGKFEDAVVCFDRALRLSPNDPGRWNFILMKGLALYGLKDFEEAIVCCKEAARQRPTAFWPHLNMAACLSALGRMDEASAALSETIKRNPGVNRKFFENIANKFPRTPSTVSRWLGDLERCGLPD